MQRTGRLLALAFLLAGVEISTSGISFTLSRLRAGAVAMSAGVEFHTSGFRFVAGLAALALGVGLWMVLTWARRLEGVLAHSGSECPACGADTDRVKRKVWHRWLGALTGQHVTRRKCPACGWIGLTAPSPGSGRG